jgi:hypothetical protein
MRFSHLIIILIFPLVLVACSDGGLPSDEIGDFGGRGADNPNTRLQPVTDLLDLSPSPANPDRDAYFGDLHVHTDYSFDAYSFGNTANPYDAYRYVSCALC